MNFDIIGDIHGHAEALKQLLKDLGYRETGGAWRHPSRQAIFVGDFIDRGPQQVETVALVRKMLDAGSAMATIGNHEFNAIAWFTPDPDAPGEHLRRHHSAKYGDANYKQHAAFLREVEDRPIHKEFIDWFLTLPVYLDLPAIRVVHACWHERFMEYLKPHLTVDRCLTEALMIEATREPDNELDKDTPEPSPFKAIEALLKGIEIPLPPPHHFHDADGHVRSRVRIRWWDSDARSYRDAAMLRESDRLALPASPIPEHVQIGYDGGKPVFVGHYWLTEIPTVLSGKVACVDYSIAKGGKLVAYRWDGEPVLDAKKFYWAGQ